MSSATLTDEQRLDWLRLIRTESVGPRTFRTLVNRFGGARGALEALPAMLRSGGRAGIKVVSRAEAEREVAATMRLGGRFIALGEPDYPKPLQAIETAPPLIALRGASGALARPTVAVVGSRNASGAGLTFTDRLTRDLGEAGYVIVSGLARGIDTRAHKAALSGGTVAVLAGGHDRVYPAENQPLLDRILDEGGAVISEMPLGWEPRGRDFPRRNRIVSGLSYGVVVVEAARRSGSLITARFALEQGREVFAVPGSPIDPRAEGTNDLIRNGATLCAAAEHVIAVLTPLLGQDPATVMLAKEPDARAPTRTMLWDELDLPDLFSDGTEPREQSAFEALPLSFEAHDRDRVPTEAERVVSLLGPSPVSIDDLARQAEVPIRVVQLILVELDLTGRIERHGGNAISLLSQEAGR